MSAVKKMIVTALLIGLGIVLPLAFHTIPNAGGTFLPMHIPVLICGMICSWPYGLMAGLLTPLLSHLLTGMPPSAILPGMVCELAAYGLATGLLMRFLPVRSHLARTYLALAGAMLTGRVVYGVLNALVFMAGKYSLAVWLTAAFVTGLPGILIQVLLIPALLAALRRARLIPVGNAAP